jgi:hypothetical protein
MEPREITLDVAPNGERMAIVWGALGPLAKVFESGAEWTTSDAYAIPDLDVSIEQARILLGVRVR